jgi:hypothetical protein
MVADITDCKVMINIVHHKVYIGAICMSNGVPAYCEEEWTCFIKMKARD